MRLKIPVSSKNSGLISTPNIIYEMVDDYPRITKSQKVMGKFPLDKHDATTIRNGGKRWGRIPAHSCSNSNLVPILLLRLLPKSSNLALENLPVNQSLLSFSDSMAEIIFKGQPIQFYPLWKTVLFSPNNTLDQPQLPAHVKIFRRQPTGDPGRLLVSSAARRMAPRPRDRWDRSARRSGAWPGIAMGVWPGPRRIGGEMGGLIPSLRFGPGFRQVVTCG